MISREDMAHSVVIGGIFTLGGLLLALLAGSPEPLYAATALGLGIAANHAYQSSYSVRRAPPPLRRHVTRGLDERRSTSSRSGLRPATMLTLDDRVRLATRPGRRAASALLDEIGRSKPFIRQYFAEVPERVQRLLVKYAALCRRLTTLEGELDPSELERLSDERLRLQGRAEETRDAVARRGFASAVASLDRTLESMERIGRDAERIEAQLAYIEAELESARARVVRIQTSAGVEAAHDRREVESAVRAIDAEVDALSQAVDEVMGETGGAAEAIDADLAACLEEETPAPPPPTAVVVSAPAGALPLAVPTPHPPETDEPRRLAERRKASAG